MHRRRSTPKKNRKPTGATMKVQTQSTPKKSQSFPDSRDRSPLDDKSFDDMDDSVVGCTPAEGEITLKTLHDILLSLKQEFTSELRDLKGSVDYVGREVEDIKRQVNVNESEIDKIKTENNLMKKKLLEIEERAKNNERYSRQFNLLYCGFPHKKEENTRQIVVNFTRDTLGISLQDWDLEVSHRLPANIPSRTPPIIAKFTSRVTVTNILSEARRKLKNGPTYLKQDLIKEDYTLKKKLAPIMKENFLKNKKVVFQHGKLYIENALYTGPETEGYY